MKAILVIDEMPKRCGECPCVNDEFEFCRADEKIRDCDRYKTPTWCPLKPLPQKKELFGKIPLDKMAEYIGWNACIDEITGETE